ncbi:hypothetical protein [Phaffia rhodozyma]|uniref:AB hydrolase-1 domain-containing protein n=1 Tax=Phaffia rhodozyma TaxID=264483 RepID=A0A0F7SSS7_PHARH|nr:hypothetical protein [Phaffia rhodozyma]
MFTTEKEIRRIANLRNISRSVGNPSQGSLLPIIPPPFVIPQIKIPAPPLVSDPNLPGYSSALHILPLAFPRASLNSTLRPDRLDPRKTWLPVVDKTDRREGLKRIKEEARTLSREVFWGREGQGRIKIGQEDLGGTLKMETRRFVKDGWQRRAGGKKGITLIVGHANGLHYQDWYLPLAKALSSLPSSLPIEVAEIWFLTNPLLDPSAGSSFFWSDLGRDVLSFINHYLPLEISLDVPHVLPRRNQPARRQGVFGVGHSFSGSSFLTAELEAGGKEGKGIWDGLFLVDAMILNPNSKVTQDLLVEHPPDQPNRIMTGAIGRRDVWDSIEECRTSLSTSPFFQQFHPTQFDSYLTHGICPLNEITGLTTSNNRVTLKHPRWLEAATFADGNWGLVEPWDRLEKFGHRAGKDCKRVAFVDAGKGGMAGSRADRELLAGLLADNPLVHQGRSHVTSTVIQDSGHLIVQERPIELAEVLKNFLVDVAEDEQMARKGFEERLSKL